MLCKVMMEQTYHYERKAVQQKLQQKLLYQYDAAGVVANQHGIFGQQRREIWMIE